MAAAPAAGVVTLREIHSSGTEALAQILAVAGSIRAEAENREASPSVGHPSAESPAAAAAGSIRAVAARP